MKHKAALNSLTKGIREVLKIQEHLGNLIQWHLKIIQICKHLLTLTSVSTGSQWPQKHGGRGGVGDVLHRFESKRNRWMNCSHNVSNVKIYIVKQKPKLHLKERKKNVPARQVSGLRQFQAGLGNRGKSRFFALWSKSQPYIFYGSNPLKINPACSWNKVELFLGTKKTQLQRTKGHIGEVVCRARGCRKAH